MEYPKFNVEQRSVRDRLKKLIKQFRKKENDERRARGISPKITELDTQLEKISEKEEASETLAADDEMEKRRFNHQSRYFYSGSPRHSMCFSVGSCAWKKIRRLKKRFEKGPW